MATVSCYVHKAIMAPYTNFLHEDGELILNVGERLHETYSPEAASALVLTVCSD